MVIPPVHPLLVSIFSDMWLINQNIQPASCNDHLLEKISATDTMKAATFGLEMKYNPKKTVAKGVFSDLEWRKSLPFNYHYFLFSSKYCP